MTYPAPTPNYEKESVIAMRALSAQPSDKEFRQISELLYRIAGIHMAPAKKPLVSSRLGKRLKQLELSNYEEYFRYITSASGKEELQHAVDSLTTNETHFFREPRHFEFLRLQVLPQRTPGRIFRIWSAACSSGEEPYSLAMLLEDAVGRGMWEVSASDISTRVLAAAQSGLFPMARRSEIPPAYLSRFCLRGIDAQSDRLLIDRALRDRVRFFAHNLTQAAPMNDTFDVIFLRNVMIYFDNATKQRVVQNLLPALRPGGYLVIGHSENLNGLGLALQVLAPSIYRKAQE